ncbi:MAG: hypothetical protein D6705_18985, partial [Deltaproteobacteria bacterium]
MAVGEARGPGRRRGSVGPTVLPCGSMPQRMDGPSLYLAAGAAFGGVALGAAAMYVGLAGRAPVPSIRAAASPPAAPAAVAEPAPNCPEEPSLAEAVARTRDAVVNLATTGGSLGAGVVVTADGLVLTNAHVVADALAAGAAGV